VTPSLLIRDAELDDGRIADLRVMGNRIAEIGTQLNTITGELQIEARGAALARGLNDHHIHLFATAAARRSVMCGPPAVQNEEALRTALLSAMHRTDGPIRGAGFHQSVCEHLDREWLDQVCPNRPVRIQHRSGMLWILNSAALEQLDFSASDDVPEGVERVTNGRWTGRFFNLDKWLRQRSFQSWPSLKQLSLELARQGITGVTDAGASNGLAEWQALACAMTDGELLQRVQAMGSEQLTACTPDINGRLTRGPLKIYLREVALPDYDALVERIRASHAHNRPIASHCVTRTELAFLLTALTEAGSIPGDRVEHASITDAHALEVMARLGVTVVTQPHFIAERGSQYLNDVGADELPLLYRGAAFLQQGIPLAAGSDAPYGAISPWRSMDAAIARNTACNTIINPRECLQGRQALALYGGSLEQPGTTLASPEVGDRADLCLLDRSWDELERAPAGVKVLLTVCNGKVTHRETADSPL
jgi:predicted amidohydrolase YtcJ